MLDPEKEKITKKESNERKETTDSKEVKEVKTPKTSKPKTVVTEEVLDEEIEKALSEDITK